MQVTYTVWSVNLMQYHATRILLKIYPHT